MRFYAGVSSALLTIMGLSVAPVWGQDAIVEGPGHEISEGTVIHPAAGFETGVDSNVFYEEDSPSVAGIARLMFRFAIASQHNKPTAEENLIDASAPDGDEGDSAPKLDFRLAGKLFALKYISTNPRVTDQDTIGGEGKAHVSVFPQGTVRFDLDERFIRDTRPQNFETRGSLNRAINHLRLGLVYQPGGRALQVGARYENTIDRFESEASAFANRLQHTVGAGVDWHFLPITKLSFDASFGFFGGLGSDSTKVSSNPLRVQAGIATALTEATQLRAHLGYANGFYASGANFNMALFGAELGFRYSQMGRVRISFDHDFRDSVNANFHRDYSLAVRVDQQLGLLVLEAAAGAKLRGYRGVPMNVGPAARDDVILHGGVKAFYLFRDWLAAMARLEAVSDQTDYRSSFGGASDDPSYSRVEVVGGVTAAF